MHAPGTTGEGNSAAPAAWSAGFARALEAAAGLTLLVGGLVLWSLVTWRGRALCLAGMAFVVGVLMAARCRLSREPRRRRLWWLGALPLLPALVAAALLALTAPSGTGRGEGLRVEHVFTRPDARFERGRLGNIVQEADQVALGIGLARWIDRFVDRQKARRIRQLTLPLYEAMGRDPDFADMGSVMSYAYAEMWGAAPRGGHYVAIVPGDAEAAKRPSVVFLHGSGGNFASYWYVLAPLARERGIAVLCPTFGFGNWHKAGGVEAALAATDHAIKRYGLDPERVYLAALSNGGRGATRVAAQHPDRFRGVALISAVLEHRPIRAGVSKGAWRGLPVLFIHGNLDLRLPIGPSRDRVAELRGGGARVSEMVMDGEDHFLLFSQRQAVIERIGAWIEACEKERPRE